MPEAINKILDVILAQHIAILGKTGSGKTSTEKLVVERAVAEGFRVCVLDSIKSDWWGITSSANGKSAGLPFQILGGPHGHVPLHSSAGKVIGQLVGSGKLPLSIVDMADFEAGGLQRFFIDFAQSLMRSAKGVVYLVIEEAHEFAPKERSGIGAENLAIHWAKKLATAGRSKGIRLIVATQRIQALHNAVLGSCETLIAHRLSAPADQEPITKWLKANADKETVDKVTASLSSLPTGTAWVCSGEGKIFEMAKLPKFKTYDNTATPTGDSAEITVKTAPVDEEALRAIIGDAVKDAEENDPVALKRQITAMRKELAAKPALKPEPPVDITRIRQDAYQEGIKAYGMAFEAWRATMAQQVFHMIGDGKGLNFDGPMKVSKRPELLKVIPESTKLDKPRFLPKPASSDLDGPQRRLINSLRFWRAIGHKAPTRAQVAAVAAYAVKGGAFIKPASQLCSKGIVDKPSKGTLRLLNDMGINDEIDARNNLLSILDGPQLRLVNSFLQHDAFVELTRSEVAQRANYEEGGGAFIKPASQLCSLNILEKPTKGMLRMSEWALEVLV